jgi:hypothetical protein
MKTAVNYLLFFAVLMQPMGQLSIFISFKLNQAYIIKNLCVNRDNPQSSCEGSCLLSKRLKQQEGSGKTIPINVNLNEFNFYVDKISVFEFIKMDTTKHRFGCFFQKSISTFQADIFHPPKPRLVIA